MSETITSARTELWRVVNAKYLPEIQKRRRVCSSQMEYLRRKHIFRFKQFHVYWGKYPNPNNFNTDSNSIIQLNQSFNIITVQQEQLENKTEQ